MAVLLVTAIAFAATGLVVYAVALRWPAATPLSPGLARTVGRTEAARHPAFRALVRRRTDPSTIVGLTLTVAVALLVVGGFATGLLFAVIRAHANGPIGWDRSAATWAATHSTPASTTILRRLTLTGGTTILVPLCTLVAVVEAIRTRTRAVLGFVVLAFGGELLVTNVVKALVDRSRPDIDRLTGFSGPSFPSGHAANAAAALAALALVLGRRRSRRTRAGLAALAVGLASAIAATRALLGVHWVTDVVAGLALGWAWFSLSAIAFGGTLLRFGEPVIAAAHAVDLADATDHPPD